jgi:murein DD-endopeptidase MepM/ murein hydrolase activator NlpD
MSVSELAFFRLLKLGSVGKDVRAVKRGLARAGHGRLAMSLNPMMGPFAVRHLKNYQEKKPPLEVDGKYGTESHKRLIESFDALARQLYEQASKETAIPVGPDSPIPGGSLQLLEDFSPTHATAGLTGFPAVDLFANPGTVVLAPENGTVIRLSGRDPSEGGRPGGAYGFSIHLDSPSGRYFMTHFATRDVTEGQQVTAGQPIGTVCDSAVSGKPNTSHIHHGKAPK